jgi:SAM-dependent methyltransferase
MRLPEGTKRQETFVFVGGEIPVFIGEFWSARQRAGHSLHEISYRACYKPELPAFFLRRFGKPGDRVFDPFLGRGTTLIEARLHGYEVLGSDINPLSIRLAAPRLLPPSLPEIRARIDEIPLADAELTAPELTVFFHPQTLVEIEGWRTWFRRRREEGNFDHIDAWLEMVCLNRLTGHSAGFFSVYTMPPNQTVSLRRQEKINARRNQVPPLRDTRVIVWKKSSRLLSDPLPTGYKEHTPALFTASADCLKPLPDACVDLVITSPPFLDEVNYLADNWLRMWFAGISMERKAIWNFASLSEWCDKIRCCLAELARVLKPGGHIAFEVGEVRKGQIHLEQEVLRAGYEVGLEPIELFIHTQYFTKTANCWGVANNTRGTNTHRICVFTK